MGSDMCIRDIVKYEVKVLIFKVQLKAEHLVFFLKEFIFFIIHLTLFYMLWFEGIRSPGTGVTNSCELPCGCWDLNLGLLEEQPVLLTAEPSLQPP